MATPALLMETIKIEEGKVANLPYHQVRCDRSRRALFASKERLELSSFIQAPPRGLYRCRILYDQEIQSVEYIPYVPKEIYTLKIISSTIEYVYKYANRDKKNSLLQEQPDADEIIIEKEGYLTDTTISNIAFYDGKRWFTPEVPLLQGTMRAKLIDEGFLHTKKIKKEELDNYTHVALINAMIGFKILNNIKIRKSNDY